MKYLFALLFLAMVSCTRKAVVTVPYKPFADVPPVGQHANPYHDRRTRVFEPEPSRIK